MDSNTENNTSQENKISICDILKDGTSDVTKKLESQVPTLVQNFSDLYTEYLHRYDDIFGTCYMAEKELFDKLNIDQKILKEIKNNLDILKKIYFDSIDMTTNFFNAYTAMRIVAIKSFDKYVHILMKSYAKNISQYNEYMRQFK